MIKMQKPCSNTKVSPVLLSNPFKETIKKNQINILNNNTSLKAKDKARDTLNLKTGKTRKKAGASLLLNNKYFKASKICNNSNFKRGKKVLVKYRCNNRFYFSSN